MLALRGVTAETVTSSAADNKHKISIPPLKKGRYYWQLFAERGITRIILDSGHVDVAPNLLSEEAGFDGRTDAEKGLDAVNACLGNKATKDQLNYTIKGRSLTRYSVDELRKLRGHFVMQVRRERGIKQKPIRVRL